MPSRRGRPSRRRRSRSRRTGRRAPASTLVVKRSRPCSSASARSFASLRPTSSGSGQIGRPSGPWTPPCSRIARIERTRCWFVPMRPVTPFMAIPTTRIPSRWAADWAVEASMLTARKTFSDSTLASVAGTLSRRWPGAALGGSLGQGPSLYASQSYKLSRTPPGRESHSRPGRGPSRRTPTLAPNSRPNSRWQRQAGASLSHPAANRRIPASSASGCAEHYPDASSLGCLVFARLTKAGAPVRGVQLCPQVRPRAVALVSSCVRLQNTSKPRPDGAFSPTRPMRAWPVARPAATCCASSVRVEGERVAEAGFDAEGCGALTAAGSAVVELVEGEAFLDAARVGPDEVDAALGGLVPAEAPRRRARGRRASSCARGRRQGGAAEPRRRIRAARSSR